MDERLPGWQTLRRRLNRREWGETRQDAHLAQTPLAGSLRLGDSRVAPEPVAAPSAKSVASVRVANPIEFVGGV